MEGNVGPGFRMGQTLARDDLCPPVRVLAHPIFNIIYIMRMFGFALEARPARFRAAAFGLHPGSACNPTSGVEE